MSVQNAKTLASYDARARAYQQATRRHLNDEEKRFIDTLLDGIDTSASVLEIGSGPGKDARYIESIGYKPNLTDASRGFVDLLLKSGYDAAQLNVITDTISADSFDVVYANAVFVHFDDADFSAALENVSQGLKSGGRLGFSLLQGEGDLWSEAKIDLPRYFFYRTKQEVDSQIARSGFEVRNYWEAESNGRVWMRYVCIKMGGE